MSTPPNPLRHAVLQSYKTLLHLGREYPHAGGFPWFRDKLHRAYSRNKGETDEDAIREGIRRAEYVMKEIEALYYLRKYRALRRMYREEGN